MPASNRAQTRGSLQPVLDSLLPDVPEALLEPEGRIDLLRAGERVPHVLARWNVGLELRLQGPARADLFLAALPTGPDGIILRDWLVDFPGGPTGARLARALSQWRQDSGWLARCCRFVLLEIDASRRIADALPPPGVFLIPRVRQGANAFHADPEGLVIALAELAGCSPDPVVTADLRRLLGLLPQRAEMFAAGVMLSRATSSAPRIAVRGLHARELAGFLSGLARDGAGAALAPLASRLAPHLTDLCVALDLGPRGSDAVGLELYCGDPSAWSRLLEALVPLGLAAGDRVDAAGELARSGGVNGSSVRLSHVKLTSAPHGLGPTKLYLVMRPGARVASVLSGREES